MVQINGSFSGSLVNELNSIPATSGAGGGPDVLYPQVAAAAIDATQLAANDVLTDYWAGYLWAYLSDGTAAGFDYAQVQAEINQTLTALRVNYKLAESNFLSSGGSGSSMKPSTAAFDRLQANTAQQIGLTVAQLGSELTGVPGATAGLVPLLTVQVSGAFTGSLGTGLSLIPIASGPGGTIGNLFPLVSTDLLNSTQLAANNLLSVFNAGRISGLTSAGFSVTPFVAKAPVMNLAQLFQLNGVGTVVQQAYTEFQSAYGSAITNALYANATAGGSGPVDLTGNQAAFNSQVAAAWGTLDGSLATTLGPYASAANNLLPSIRQALIGTGAAESSEPARRAPYPHGPLWCNHGAIPEPGERADRGVVPRHHRAAQWRRAEPRLQLRGLRGECLVPERAVRHPASQHAVRPVAAGRPLRVELGRGDGLSDRRN